MKARGPILGCMLLSTVGSASAADLQRGIEAFQQHDYAAALAEFRPLATEGITLAQDRLCLMYAHGWGVKQDGDQARTWCLKAVAQGFVPAEAHLGRLYLDGTGVGRDYTKAFEWLGKAAAAGDPAAQGNLGFLYLNGQGTPQDFSKAASWFAEAASRGNAYAQSNLGLMYASGRGLSKDFVAGYALLVLSSGTLDANTDVAGKSVRNRKMVADQMTPAQLEESKVLAAQLQRAGLLAAFKQHGIPLPEAMMEPGFTPPPAPAPPPGYFPAGLDLTYQQAHPAQFPREAIAAGHQGLVVVMARVQANGQVEDVQVSRSSGYPELDASAVAAVSSWKYTPCHINKQPVACYVRTPVNFALSAKPDAH